MKRIIGVWAAAVLLALSPAYGDWKGWRGNARDGRIEDFPSPEAWPEELERRWSVEVGSGHASPVVLGERVFHLSRQGEEEVVRALELETGTELWRRGYEVKFKPSMGSGKHGNSPKSTPSAADGRLVTLGISGVLSAWDAGTGELLWRHQASEDFDDVAPRFGAAMSPLLSDGRVIVHLGGKSGGALRAFDLATGDQVWSRGGDGPAYASPIRVELDGVEQIVSQSRNSTLAVTPDSGEVLWQIPFKSALAVHNTVTPAVYRDLLILSGKKHGIWAVRPRRDGETWSLAEVWRNDDLPAYLSSPVVAGDRLFALSHLRKGQLFAAEAATGELLWKTEGRTAENAVFLTAPGIVLMLTTDGELAVLDADAGGLERLASYRVADSETWAHPAIVGDKILIKDVDSLTLWKLPAAP